MSNFMKYPLILFGMISAGHAIGDVAVDDQYLVRLHLQYGGDIASQNLALKEHIDTMKLQIGEAKFSVLNVYSELTELSSSLSLSVPPRHLTHLPHYSAKISSDSIDFFKNHESVDKIEPDSIISLDYCMEQKKPDWGLTRLNQGVGYEYDSYFYDTMTWGQGVNAYILGG